MKLNTKELKNAKEIIRKAFIEDEVSQDVTSKLFVPSDVKVKAVIRAKEDGVLAGVTIAKQVFYSLDPKLRIQEKICDGDKLTKNKAVLTITGSLRSVLSAERTALNFLGHLSGVATLTSQFIKAANSKHVKIMDTRKTAPGLRALEKYAVRCGGGVNHRMSLAGSVFIKDNHWLYGDVINWDKPLKKIKQSKKELIVEVETETQLKRALDLNPNVILLDNMTPVRLKQISKRIKRLKKCPELEASGGINLGNIARYAKSGVDRISIGALTHSASNLDFSLEVL